MFFAALFATRGVAVIHGLVFSSVDDGGACDHGKGTEDGEKSGGAHAAKTVGH